VTVEQLRGMNSRIGALSRARFSAADGEDAAIGSYWLMRFALMDPGEIAAVIRERATAPGGAALAYLGHLSARGKLAAIGGEEERHAAAEALQAALEAVPCEVDQLASLLDAAVAEVGRGDVVTSVGGEGRAKAAGGAQAGEVGR
jgi:hypothetical protein